MFAARLLRPASRLPALRPPRLARLAPRSLWLLPVSAGLLLLFLPPRSPPPSILASPAIIPCPAHNRISPFIFSPSEHSRSLLRRILAFLRTRIWEPILTSKRFLHLLALFTPVIICSPILLVGKTDARLKGDRWGAVWWYGLLVRQMSAAGPTLIKLAQWAASRADLFPTLMCEKLGTLHSRGKQHSLDHTKNVIERVFQRPFDQVFEEFDETPIGTGAIAQVYRATLKKDLIPPAYLGPRRTGKRKTHAGALAPVILQQPPPSVPSASVAIKILHPHVDKMISRDLSIMAFFARCISLLPGMQWISLPQEVQVFGTLMSRQLDLRLEADNLETFEHNFAHRRVPVTFPRPLKLWSTTDLLVEEYENAVSLEYFLANGAGPFDEQLATVGLDAFLHMLLLDNFVHSDLHPGNIMIKFIKQPNTKVYLQSLLHYFFHKGNPAADDSEFGNGLFVPADYSESDRIVDQLRQLKRWPSAWRAELNALYREGYFPEIVFIDAGLVTTLDVTNRRNFINLFKAVAEFDGYRVGQLMVEHSRTPELAIETETFALKMQHLVLSIKRKTFSLGQIKLSDLLADVLKAVRAHHVKMEGDFINTVIAVLLLEGIGRRLDPNLDLFASALPILRQLGGTMATRENINRNLPSSELGTLLKVWVWVEARSLISAAIVNADDLIKYDLLCPSV
ncbi:hypothetical protein APHAL10511_006028 [Amanita phalloides]|nr:hypothetical protein APHAL10511_006028 [Amanita phalloides]